MNLPRAVVSVGLLLAVAGCNSTENEATTSNAALTSNSDPSVQARLALLRTKLVELASTASHDFAASTKTIALNEVVSTACTGREFAELGVPTITVDGCTFVFRNGASTTTFTGSVAAYVILKGQPDPTAPNDPQTGAERPATEDKVVPLPGGGLNVKAGLAPRFIQPISLEGGSLGDYIRETRGAFEVSELDAEACQHLDRPEIGATNTVGEKCFRWSDEDREHTSLILFAAEGNNAVGLYWMGW